MISRIMTTDTIHRYQTPIQEMETALFLNMDLCKNWPWYLLALQRDGEIIEKTPMERTVSAVRHSSSHFSGSCWYFLLLSSP